MTRLTNLVQFPGLGLSFELNRVAFSIGRFNVYWYGVCLYIGRAIKGIDAFGGGDIKLMAFAGLFLGWKYIILAFLIGCILGAVIHSIRSRFQL